MALFGLNGAGASRSGSAARSTQALAGDPSGWQPSWLDKLGIFLAPEFSQHLADQRVAHANLDLARNNAADMALFSTPQSTGTMTTAANDSSTDANGTPWLVKPAAPLSLPALAGGASAQGNLPGATYTPPAARNFHNPLYSVADQAGLTNEQKLAFVTDPAKFAEALDTHYQAANVGGGDSRFIPGIGFVTAPKVGMEGDSFFTQTPKGVTITGKRPPSLKEIADMTKPVGIADDQNVFQFQLPGASQTGQAPTGQAPSTAPATPARPAAPFDPVNFYKNFVLKHEGGLNPHDMNGSPTNMGFNQKANPDIDVRTLTPDTAAQRFASNYYGPSGAGKLPPAMAAVYSDTYFINPSKARAFLSQANGDPNKFMDLREQWMGGLLKSNPAAQPYAKAWSERNSDLRQYAGGLAPQAQAASPDASAQPDAQMGGYQLVRSAADNPLTPDTVDYVAQQYMLTGQLPPMGMGKAATKNRDMILNRAAEIERETGSTGADAVTRHVAVKAASNSLGAISKMRNTVEASESTVSKNMDLVMGLARKGAGPTGSPLLNAPIQELRNTVWGSPDVASFNSAIGTVADEYAKVMSTNTGAGGAPSSDSARKEAYSRLSKAATVGQLVQVMATLRKEMANRTSSLRDQESQLTETIRTAGRNLKPSTDGLPGAGAATPPTISSEAEYNALPKGTVYVAPDGNRRVKK